MNKNTFKKLSKNRSAFTLVELLVAIGLFGVIVSIAIGGFVRALRTQRQVVALINANSNVSLVIEQIAREIRTGYNFCESTCTPTSLNFTDAKNHHIVYDYLPSVGHGAITRQEDSGEVVPITADNVDIRYLNFTRLQDANSPSPTDPLYPPRITINITLSPTAVGQVASETNIQTTVSARSFAGG